jgi:hypothetical protein
MQQILLFSILTVSLKSAELVRSNRISTGSDSACTVAFFISFFSEMNDSMLQNQLYRIQDTINLDDSTRWEINRGTPYEEEISLIFTENESDKTRKLAYAVNDQLHDIRDAFYALEKKNIYFSNEKKNCGKTLDGM